ncbi:type I-G CRISPR-associated protein Csb2 [Thiorhodococcus minor]|uniref:Type I-U CRISPR-associated protein Cas5/Cas6 n=1 Tax=Thiorhodococcus minor TaxID=57489 RepID=A0A6M0JU92_9GAMM|nr:type I-U CRISPR-associated protein Csb2 [Thiorhodococcus minor]NEV60664.1 type I-U CRISPR-associated protein Cas5/Cas6 [Thiorhodococcus minor]
MLALGIHYLNGWAMAAAGGASKSHAEWPPHPDRVFMAMAAAWLETGRDPDEGAALEWLESLEPPGISATDAEVRTAGSDWRLPVSYVPVNDVRVSKKAPAVSSLGKLQDAGLSTLPEHRPRQARHFPVAVPHEPIVHLVWPDADAVQHRKALQRLARKVTNIGHSASLAQMWLEQEPVEARWTPTDSIAQHRLRIPSAGRLRYLVERCNRDAAVAYADLRARVQSAKGRQKKTLQTDLETRFGTSAPVSLRPEPGLWQGYAKAHPEGAADLPRGLFDPRLVVLTLRGHRLPLPAALKLTNAARCTLLKAVAELNGQSQTAVCEGGTDQAAALVRAFDYPEWLSGHRLDGRASSQPHIAFAPLPFVDAKHADGRIMGLALILPRRIPAGEVGRWLEPWLRDDSGLPRDIRLFDGQWVETRTTLETREDVPWNLRPETWTAPGRGATRWASVTPVVLDRHFKGADKWRKAAESIKDACRRIDLPPPDHVELRPTSWVRGVPRANEFPYLSRKSDGGRMHHAHAVLQFDQPVVGPVLIGAGRFRGYGLCRPLRDRDSQSTE